MRYSDDPDLKGDVDIVARGAASILEKESAQQRRNEFLTVALNSPAAQQVVGMEGIAELLRQAASTLDMNVDKIVPSPEAMKLKQAQADQAMAMQNAAALTNEQQGNPMQGGTPAALPGGKQLMDGAPVTDRFSQ